MGEEKEDKKAPENNVAMGVLCYLGILVLIPLLTDAKNDAFVKYHIKQGLVLLIFWIVASFIFWLPVIGQLLWLGVVILVILGIINVVNGKQQPLPLIGQFADKINV